MSAEEGSGASAGRAAAFEELVGRYARLMASAIRRVCGQRHGHLVPDAQQEVYVALWKRLGSGKEIEHPPSYLYKVALTTAFAVLRRHVRGGSADALEERADGLTATAGTAGGVAGLGPQERAQLLRQLLERLPPEQAQALRGYLAGFNHKELATLHGWSEAVARHRVYRAIEALRAALGERS